MRIYLSPKRWEVTQTIATDELAVSVAEVKASARMDSGDSLLDAVIERNIKSVQRRIEAYTGMSIFKKEFCGYYDEFPPVMEVTKFPEVSFVKVEYEDENGVTKELDSDSLQLQKYETRSNVFPVDDYIYPSVLDFTVDSVRLFIHAGWASASVVPDDVKDAIIDSVVYMLTGDCDSKDILTKVAKDYLSIYRDESVLI